MSGGRRRSYLRIRQTGLHCGNGKKRLDCAAEPKGHGTAVRQRPRKRRGVSLLLSVQRKQIVSRCFDILPLRVSHIQRKRPRDAFDFKVKDAFIANLLQGVHDRLPADVAEKYGEVMVIVPPVVMHMDALEARADLPQAGAGILIYKVTVSEIPADAGIRRASTRAQCQGRNGGSLKSAMFSMAMPIPFFSPSSMNGAK